jgi:hypothetical protein
MSDSSEDSSEKIKAREYSKRYREKNPMYVKMYAQRRYQERREEILKIRKEHREKLKQEGKLPVNKPRQRPFKAFQIFQVDF